ncbi:MAG: hypothetical protein E7167_01135 [Firmicutes bacterium]|nr:hypothetical protein [Bacillota bacterium]
MISVKEQDILLINDILNRNYYYYYKKGNTKNISISFYNNNDYNNSIFIKEQEINNDINKIINNFILFLNWYNNNNFICDLYIEDDNWFFNDILKEKVFTLLSENFSDSKVNKIINFTFEIEKLKDQDLIFLEEKIKEFKLYNLDIKINFNLEISKSTQCNIHNFLSFCKEYNLNIYNRITPENIIDQKNFFKFLIQTIPYSQIQIIEQESELWNEENIDIYIDFINFYIDYFIQLKQDNFINFLLNENSIISLKDKGIINNTGTCKQNCNLHKNLHIILNDLSLTMCKKIQYDDLTIGFFEVENNIITKCIPNNISALIVCAHSKHNMTPQCEYCFYMPLCPGFCHGDAYYKVLNPLIPIRETCQLKRAKYSFLIYKILKLNLSEKIKNEITEESYKQYFSILCNNLINSSQTGGLV